MTYEPDRGDARREDIPEVTVFEQYPVGSWTVQGSTKVVFPVQKITESGGNRVVERERPFRDGAKLDDTGSKAKRWSLVAVFENSIEEAGLSDNGDLALYPDILNELINSFDLYHEEPGDLVIPTRGAVRARLETYNRVESPENQNCCFLEMNFVEDNEDSVDARSFTAPTANANARQLAETLEFSSQSDGTWGGSIQDLNEFMANLEGLANAPSEYARDIDQQTAIIIGAANRANIAFTQPNTDGRDILLDPGSSATQRKLEQSKDIAYKARYNPKRNQRTLISVVFQHDQSLMSVAAMLRQSFEDLLDANYQLSNPLFIPAGTVVKVFSNATSGQA